MARFLPALALFLVLGCAPALASAENWTIVVDDAGDARFTVEVFPTPEEYETARKLPVSDPGFLQNLSDGLARDFGITGVEGLSIELTGDTVREGFTARGFALRREDHWETRPVKRIKGNVTLAVPKGYEISRGSGPSATWSGLTRLDPIRYGPPTSPAVAPPPPLLPSPAGEPHTTPSLAPGPAPQTPPLPGRPSVDPLPIAAAGVAAAIVIGAAWRATRRPATSPRPERRASPSEKLGALGDRPPRPPWGGAAGQRLRPERPVSPPQKPGGARSRPPPPPLWGGTSQPRPKRISPKGRR